MYFVIKKSLIWTVSSMISQLFVVFLQLKATDYGNQESRIYIEQPHGYIMS